MRGKHSVIDLDTNKMRSLNQSFVNYKACWNLNIQHLILTAKILYIICSKGLKLDLLEALEIHKNVLTLQK